MNEHPKKTDGITTIGLAGIIHSRSGGAALILVLVFLSCLVGIYSRPIGFLATVWPANAVLLGLLVRMPRAAGGPGWVAAGLAYMAADLLTGSALPRALLLNAANLAGVAVAFLVCARFSVSMVYLRQPKALLYLVIASVAAGASAGLVGGIANPVLFGRGVLSGWAFWCITEIVNYVTILPVILAAPSLPAWGGARRNVHAWPPWRGILPVAALALSGLAVLWIGGPGAIAFPVPALLWCSLVYPVFPTAILTLLFGAWNLVALSTVSASGPAGPADEMALVSLRLGVALIALAPIMLAGAMQNLNELLNRFRHLALHDPLTGASNRHAFWEKAHVFAGRPPASCAVLMMDLDHFKAVNDGYGHGAGDRVLVSFAERARQCLRASDFLARMGGEEFAAILLDCSQADAVGVAERIRAAAAEPILLEDGRSLSVTVSIGMVVIGEGGATGIEATLSEADALLYRAKENGRDRVEMAVKCTAREDTGLLGPRAQPV